MISLTWAFIDTIYKNYNQKSIRPQTSQQICKVYAAAPNGQSILGALTQVDSILGLANGQAAVRQATLTLIKVDLLESI